MQIKQLLCAAAMCGVGAVASAQTLLGQTPIGIKGTFTLELMGCTTTTTGTGSYVKNTVTGLVTVTLPESLLCTSNAGMTLNMIGLPAELVPPESVRVPMVLNNAGRLVPGFLTIPANGSNILGSAWDGVSMNGLAWTAGQLKGLAGWGWTFSYLASPDN